MRDEAQFKIHYDYETGFKLSIVSRWLCFTRLYSGHESFVDLLIKRTCRDMPRFTKLDEFDVARDQLEI